MRSSLKTVLATVLTASKLWIPVVSLQRPIAMAAARAPPSAARLVVVSGASRGVGVGICRQVLKADPTAHVVVTARKLDQAEAVRDALNDEFDDGSATATPGGRAHAFRLDVSDEESCQSLADALSANDDDDAYGPADRPISVVCNAGVGLDLPWFPTPWPADAASRTLDVNLFGAERLASAFMPRLLKSTDGRVILISSGGGRANMMRMSEERRKEMLGDDVTWDGIRAMAKTFTEEYESAAEAAVADPESRQLPFLSPSGYWLQSYGMSKAAMGSYCQILDRDHGPGGLLCVACSPGFIATDMSKTYAKYDELKTIDEGGEVVAWLATCDREGEGLRGGVFYTPDRQVVSWVADP